MLMPVPCRCQVLQFEATPTGPAPYITTKLVALVKFDTTNWLFWRSIGVYRGLNGSYAVGASAMADRAPTAYTKLQFPERTSTNPIRPERFPLHQTRFGLFGSISSLLGSDSESGSGNSTHSPVLGLKRAILSACCSLTQTKSFLRSIVTEYAP